MGTPYRRLVEVAEELSHRSSRLQKLRILTAFLSSLRPEEVAPAVRLLLGQRPGGSPLEVGWATLRRLSSGTTVSVLNGSRVSITEVWDVLQRVAGVRGPGSRKRKERLLAGLFSRVGRREAEWLMRCILGEMRTGVSEGLMSEAVARAFNVDVERLRLVAALRGDVAGVAGALAAGGHLPEPRIRLFTPVRPMMAQPAASLEEALRGEVALEYKYDGTRVQVHLAGGEVRIFSRRLRELSLPGVVPLVEQIDAEQAVLDGEVVAVDDAGRPLPFQDVMRSLAGGGRLRLYLFDLLHLNGRDLLEVSYAGRWRLLEKIAGEELLAERTVTSSREEAEEFYRRAVEAGHEGVVVKRLEAHYHPGRRSDVWLKVKPFVTLDLVVTGAEWGHGRRRRWLSNLHLAVRGSSGFLMVGKTFKGLSDAMLEEITGELLRHRVSEEGGVVRVVPTLVVEVAFDEVQRSPRYDSGFALRFARVRRLRRDKSVEEADTIERLREVYRAQLRRKGRL
ncbi:MAG: ATP-dependent DNA ligase [Euryarchaeota archaeon]|nr:ATP-dependent DNA ligase [Euryarchaeota archaeon]